MSISSINGAQLASQKQTVFANGLDPVLSNSFNPDEARLVSVINVIDDSVDRLSGCKVPKKQALFACRLMIQTLKRLRDGRYSDFDAITTSHSCHGIAIYGLRLIASLQGLELEGLIAEGEDWLRKMENTSDLEVNFSWFVPDSLISLARLHVLYLVREPNAKRGAFTNKNRLREIAGLGKKYIDALVSRLQKQHSNLAAESYFMLSRTIDGNTEISGVPLWVWRKYVHPTNLRSDRRGVLYASNLHSMQVCGAVLSDLKAKVALVNDFQGGQGVTIGRHIAVYEGDGCGNFTQLPSDGVKALAIFQGHTPVVVLGGCSKQASDKSIQETIDWMDDWRGRLWELVLACDTRYLPFPKVSSDPDFDSSSIPSEDDILRASIESHSDVDGVTSTNPSKFCLTHIYLASIGQVVSGALPSSCIPINKSISSETGE